MYHYFNSKDELLAEIYARALRMQMKRLESFVAADGLVQDRVDDAAADVVVTTIENLDSTTIYFRSLHQLAEDKRGRCGPSVGATTTSYAAFSWTSQRAEVFRSDVDADLVVDYFFESVHHLPM